MAEERKRPDQQLEPNEMMQAQVDNLFINNSGLRDSVVLLDHQDASSLQLQPDQIISSSNTNQNNEGFNI